MDLYESIAARVMAGEDYYVAALAEQRAHDYPTAPFVTVRSPAMAWGDALWGPGGWRMVAVAMLLIGIIGWTVRLSHMRHPAAVLPAERIGAAIVIFLCGIAAFDERVHVLHEVIAGLALTAAFAFYGTRYWLVGLFFIAVAVAVRELAVPALLLWSALAAMRRSWREVAVALALLASFALGMAAHAHAVLELRLPGDATSEGWTGMGGPAFVLDAVRRLTPLAFAPAWLAVPLAILPMVGWAGLGSRAAFAVLLWSAGFALIIAVAARPENFYWAQLILPIYAAGLVFTPRAIADLVKAARGTSKS